MSSSATTTEVMVVFLSAVKMTTHATLQPLKYADNRERLMQGKTSTQGKKHGQSLDVERSAAGTLS